MTRMLLPRLESWLEDSPLPHDELPLSGSVIRSLLATRFIEGDFDLHSIIKYVLKAAFPELSDGTLHQFTVEIYDMYLFPNRHALERLLRHISKWMHSIKVIDQILKVALLIAQAVWYIVKAMTLPGSDESDNMNIDPAEAKQI